MHGRMVRIDPCKDTSDLNYGGWDILVQTREGLVCVSETNSYQKAELIAQAIKNTIDLLDKEFSEMF